MDEVPFLLGHNEARILQDSEMLRYRALRDRQFSRKRANTEASSFQELDYPHAGIDAERFEEICNMSGPFHLAPLF
jgi:hypothetical protein